MERTFDGWAMLELLGHRRHFGRVTTVTLGGAPMIHIVALEWDTGAKATKEREHYYAPSALYGLTPCTEEEARAAVKPTIYDYANQLTDGDDSDLGPIDGGF